MTDEEYMQIAIDLSKAAKYPYGAIVVNPGGGNHWSQRQHKGET